MGGYTGPDVARRSACGRCCPTVSTRRLPVAVTGQVASLLQHRALFPRPLLCRAESLFANCSHLRPFSTDVLDTHPDFKHLLRSGALFHDPNRRRPSSFSSTSDSNTTRNAVVTRIWSAAPGTTDVGAWVDLSSEAGATWWAKGVGGLIELGVDGIWK